MILDLIVLAILIIPMAIGLRRGLMNMFMRTFGWIIAIAAAFFLKGPVSDALEQSAAGSQIHSDISDKFSESAGSAASAADGLPDIIRGGVAVAADSTAEIFAGIISSMVIGVLSFIIVVIAVKLILRFAVKPAARREGRGVLNTSDRLLGLAVGFIEGILLVFLFLAALVPAAGFASADTAAGIAGALEDSYVAGTLYDNNFLFLVIGGMFS